MVREDPGGTVVEVRVILAETLGVARRAVTIVSGDNARQKRVLVAGLRPGDVAAKLRSRP